MNLWRRLYLLILGVHFVLSFAGLLLVVFLVFKEQWLPAIFFLLARKQFVEWTGRIVDRARNHAEANAEVGS